MRLNEEQYQEFCDQLQERGYRMYRGTSNKADHSWCKSFRRESEELRGYQVVLNVYDFEPYREAMGDGYFRYSISFSMFMNHQTSMLFDVVDLRLLKNDMTVLEFEGYCDRLYDAFMGIFPKKEVEVNGTN